MLKRTLAVSMITPLLFALPVQANQVEFYGETFESYAVGATDINGYREQYQVGTGNIISPPGDEIVVTNSLKYEGNNSLRLERPSSIRRVEIGKDPFFTKGNHLWVGFARYLEPSGFSTKNSNNKVWLSQTYAPSNCESGNEQGSIYIETDTASSSHRVYVKGINGDFGTAKFGTWFTVVFHMYRSSNNTGFVEAWINGVYLKSNVSFNQCSENIAIKFGQYGAEGDMPAQSWIDNIKIGEYDDGSSHKAEVTP